MIPYGKQDISQADIDAVVRVLQSDFLTQGPVVPLFEDALAQYSGAKHAVAVNSATSALHLACLALQVGEGDIVWTTPITFVASANCALYCGAKVDFVDIDSKTYNMSVSALEAKLESASLLGRLPKVVIPVHLCGQSCEMAEIWRLSKMYGFKVIEDASHAVGGRYKDFSIGGGQYSDITIFSFHPVKIITTAEGGVAVTNNEELAVKMQLLRSHGITRDPKLIRATDGPWYYEQIALGFNYRMTELQAALGLSQLSRLDEFVSKRHALAAVYDQSLAALPLELPYQHADCYSAYHLYVVRVKSKRISHEECFLKLRESGVGVNLHYIPVYKQPFYQAMGFPMGYCPEAECYYKEAISLPIYFGLEVSEQRKIISTLLSLLGE